MVLMSHSATRLVRLSGTQVRFAEQKEQKAGTTCRGSRTDTFKAVGKLMIRRRAAHLEIDIVGNTLL